VRRLLLLAVLVLAGCGSDDATEASGDEIGGAAVELVATEFAFDPDSVEVDEAGETTFRLVNEGEFPHALEIEGGDLEEETEEIGPGETTELTVDLEPGEYELYCPVGDHREQGMEGTLVVAGGSAGASTGTGKTESDSDYGYGYGYGDG
jgi:plastocyanin